MPTLLKVSSYSCFVILIFIHDAVHVVNLLRTIFVHVFEFDPQAPEVSVCERGSLTTGSLIFFFNFSFGFVGKPRFENITTELSGHDAPFGF